MFISLHSQQDAIRVDDANKHVIVSEAIVKRQIALRREHDRRLHKCREKPNGLRYGLGFFFQIEPVLRNLFVIFTPYHNQTDLESGIV